MNAYGLYRRAATAIRALLLVLSGAGIGLLYVWHASPSTIEAVDEALRQRHLRPHQERLDAAVAAGEQGEPALAISLLEETRRELLAVHKGDRLDPLKRQTFENLVQAYEDTARQKEALAILDEWIAFDSRDLRAVARQAANQGSDGLAAMLELRARFPQARFLETELPKVLAKAPPTADTFALLAEVIRTPPRRRWQVYWDAGAGIRAADSQRFAMTIDGTTGESSFDLAVPGHSSRLRIDAPNASHLVVTALRVRLEGRGSSTTITLSNANPRNHIRNLDDNTLETTGRDPHLHVKIPASARGAEHLKVQVRGRVRTAPPPELAEHLIHPDATKILQELDHRGDTEPARELRQMRQWLLAASSQGRP